jgi:hypothetical protein
MLLRNQLFIGGAARSGLEEFLEYKSLQLKA